MRIFIGGMNYGHDAVVKMMNLVRSGSYPVPPSKYVKNRYLDHTVVPAKEDAEIDSELIAMDVKNGNLVL